ncbi:hst3 protein [Moniliophthora roreri]|nr:hst3 protein [Moniliophthora roreri]
MGALTHKIVVEAQNGRVTIRCRVLPLQHYRRRWKPRSSSGLLVKDQPWLS